MRLALVVKSLLFTLAFPCTILAWAPWFLIVGPDAARAHLPPSVAEIPGALVAVAGFGTYLACAWRFSVDGDGTAAPWWAPGELVVRGLYRFTRNPMYVGIVAAALGEAWWFQSSAMLAFAAIVALGFHLRVVAYEEPVLRREFGDRYDSYCHAVKRWGAF